jgi:hypothetical protein
MRLPAPAIVTSLAAVLESATIHDYRADTSSQPYNFSHLLTVKLSVDNYLLWRPHVLPLLRNNYLEGFVIGTMSCPAMVNMISASGAPVLVTNPGHRQWVAQDQAILSHPLVLSDVVDVGR